MANKNIDALVLCPFYACESGKSITCEGIIGCGCTNKFNTISGKISHQETYCTKADYNKCRMFKALMEKY